MIDGLKPYPNYKDSGVPWLGEVPEHWEVQRLKYLFREVDERSDTGDEELLSVSHLTGVTPRREKNVTMFLAESNVGHKLCAPGDVVVNTMWAWMAALGVARQHGMVSPSYAVYRPRNDGKLAPMFVDRLLRTEALRTEYVRRSTGVNSSRMRLYPEQFLTIRIPFPSIDEQEAIGRLLAHVDRQIARYIRAKKKLIALLNEQKHAVIHHAVTRGLHPNVRLRPSGVEHLGPIPIHWKRLPIRQIAARSKSAIVNGPFGSDLLTTELVAEGVPVIYIRDISSGAYRRVSTVHVTRAKAAELSFCEVQPGDILIAKVGDPPGTAAVYPQNAPNGIVTQDVVRLRPNLKSVLPSYIAIFLNSQAGRAAIGPIVVESTRGRFSLPDFRQVPIFLPPLGEQAEIVDTTTRISVAVERLSTQALAEVTYLREFRDRLVSDVVSGRVDVREAVTHLRASDAADEFSEIGDTDEELGDEFDAEAERVEVED